MDNTFSDGKGPLSPERLAQAERGMGVTFPPEYRDFMLRQNGGQPARTDFRFAKASGSYTDGSVRRLYAIEDLGSSNVESKYRIFSAVTPPRIPRDALAIGSDPFGNQICIVVSGPKCGHVYFWDHENEDDDEPTYANMHLIAESFSEFLAKLT